MTNHRALVSRGWILAACSCAIAIITPLAQADVSFTAKRMTRGDVPSGKGQCDIRFRVDNEVELSIRGDRVQIRAISGRDSRDEGSECNFPLPTGEINNFRWEKRDGRGRVELIETPSRRSGNRAIFNVRDSDGGDDRYHIRLNWDIEGSSSVGGGRGGRNDRSDRNTGRGSSSSSSSNNSGWGNSGSSGSSGNGSGWGTGGNGWGNVRPPSSLTASGRGTVTWDRRDNLDISTASVTVRGNQATIRFRTSANRDVELRGQVTDSSNGFFEVNLNGSSEGNIDGVARIDYRNNSQLDRVNAYGNAGNDRFRFDFRR